jgi:hypothetical protein
MDYTGFKAKTYQNLTVAEWCCEQGHYEACCNRQLDRLVYELHGLLEEEISVTALFRRCNA